MDTKFIPGPWSIGPVDDCQITHLGPDGGRYEIADISGDYNQPELWPIMEANARLISAAPDMYEALKKLVERIDFNGGIGEYQGGPAFVMEKARAALAKVQP